MGGGNAGSTVSEHPELATALVLEDAGMRGGGARRPNAAPGVTRSIFAKHLELVEADLSLEEMTAKIDAMSPGQPEYYAEWKAECLLQMDTEIMRGTVDDTRRGRSDPAEILAKIEFPVLFMQADPNSGGINTDEYLAETIPHRDNFTVKKIIGAGHNINREHTELLWPVVTPGLEGLAQ
jgi:pimeloyl-ACP methyl ester carboxylesterase